LTVVAIVLGIAIAAGAVLLVAWPFLREPVAPDYRSQVGPLCREAATALRRLDRYRTPMIAFETPEVPSEPAPPPDEGTPPTPAPVPEPYPPPEVDIPTPQE
jgi:hypothetical protein